MNNHERILQMIPDYINGTLSDAEMHIVEQALASSHDLQHKHDEYVHVFTALKKEDIIQLMNDEVESVDVILPFKAKRKMLIPKIMIGTTTSIAACLLLWIGINEQSPINIQNGNVMKIPTIELAETIDEYTPLELQSEDVEEVILDEILTVYVSDIESGKEINPLLEKEITNYLLQENTDEEIL
jgi:hypothetical protein